MNLKTLVFADESEAKTNMTRLYEIAKSRPGELIRALVHNDNDISASTACILIEGAMNKYVLRPVFSTFFVQLLSPY